MKRKLIIAIADGIGDRPIAQFDRLTPLQHAKTPHLNWVAEHGQTGLMDPIMPGIPVGTDMGHLILFGNDHRLYPGRGPIEAAGVGLPLQAGDIAFRCNFATLGDNDIVVDRRAGRIRQGTAQLAEALNGQIINGVEVLFHEATEHRAVLVLRGEGLSAAVTDTDPKAPNDGSPLKVAKAKDDTPEAAFTAEVLNEVIKRSFELFDTHPVNQERREEGKLPANVIITRGAGQMTAIDPFTERLNFKGAVVAAEDTVLGMGRLSGLTPIKEASFTGNLDTDVEAKATAAAKALEDNDVVYVHLKAPDIMGHDNNPEGKVLAIEAFDRLVKSVLDQIDLEHTYLALVADHSTPCEKGEHSGEPVPVAYCGPSVRVDTVTTYDEIACQRGGISRVTGTEYISLLFDLLNIIPKQGN